MISPLILKNTNLGIEVSWPCYIGNTLVVLPIFGA